MAELNYTPKDYYVYIHRRKTDERVFYVGKGFGDRYKYTTSRNRHWHNITNKHGFFAELVIDGLQDWYAKEIEMQTISFYGKESLCNATDGGEGCQGFKHSKESKNKMSAWQKGRKLPDWHIQKLKQKPKVSDETRKKLSNIHKGKIVSLDTKLKMSIAQKGNKNNLGLKRTNETKLLQSINNNRRRGVVCSNGMSFISQNFAKKWLIENGFPKAIQSAISACCRGKYSHAYGFTWSYEK